MFMSCRLIHLSHLLLSTKFTIYIHLLQVSEAPPPPPSPKAYPSPPTVKPAPDSIWSTFKPFEQFSMPLLPPPIGERGNQIRFLKKPLAIMSQNLFYVYQLHFMSRQSFAMIHGEEEVKTNDYVQINNML